MKNFFVSFHMVFFSVGLALAMTTDITLKNEVTVDKENIELGDISSISTSEISGLVLGTSPEVGQQALWSRSEISRRLRPYQAVLKDFHFKIPNEIKIYRQSLVFNEKLVKEKIVAMLQGTLPNGSWEVSLKELQKITLPELAPSQKWYVLPLTQRPRGPTQFEMAIEDKGKIVNHIWVNGFVEYFAKVPVLQVAMSAREKFKSENISWERKNMTFASEVPVMASDMESTVSKIPLVPGTVITKSHLDRELAVKFGDEVEMFAGGNDFWVSSKGISQQNGYIGDTVKVRSLHGQKTLAGVLVAKGKVQVSY